ncbi:MAG: single-stranded DNA-binding protein, partial [Vulcanimicrobiaceae bacterium]
STLIEGRLSIRKYETKEGEKRTAVEIVASDMQMLDSRGGGGARSTEGGASYERGSTRPAGNETEAEPEGMEDEIPF